MFYVFNLIVNEVYNQVKTLYFHDFFTMFFSAISPLPTDLTNRATIHRIVEEFWDRKSVV